MAKPSEISKLKRRHTALRHLRLVKYIDYPGLFLTAVLPIFAIICSTQIKIHTRTIEFSVWYYICTISCINGGYHRMWAHRAFAGTWLLKFVYAFFGASAGLGPAKWWASVHRAHHRYVDTEKDPHYIRRGFGYAHIGWRLFQSHPKVKSSIKECHGDDLEGDTLLDWQEKNYYELFIITALVLPTVACGLLSGDFIGGLVYGGILRMACVQQSTFIVNSMGHLWGTQCYDGRKSHKNNWILSVLTFGEGMNNFHHEFSSDYRNGINWYDFDPIKLQVYLLYKFGLVQSLHRVSEQAVNQSMIQFQQKVIDRRRAKLDWGIPIDKLPIISPAEFKSWAEESKPQRALIAVAGIVHDVAPFINDHPGGIALIKTSIGKDATSAFNGAVYDHTVAAHNLLATMRVAVLSGGTEQIVWRQQQKENKEVPLKQDSKGRKIERSGEQATIVKRHGRTAGAA